MNIYEKLSNCRIKLQEMNIKKSGKNAFAGFEYYELQDFIPLINRLFIENKLMGVFGICEDTATLKIVDTEKPDEFILFTTPTAEANLKGCHPIQNLGAVHTYLRRYLYVNALEIVEQDQLDKTINPNVKIEENTASQKQLELLGKFLNENEIESIKDKFKIESIEQLTTKQASEIIKRKMNG